MDASYCLDTVASVAIATGDWFETSTFKLGAAGIPLDNLPMVTSTDFYSRGDIIAAAAAKAGRTLHETVYIGDGPCDLRSCQKLGVPFIGVGRRKEKLESAGAVYTLPDFSPVSFWRVMEMIWNPNSAVASVDTAPCDHHGLPPAGQ